MICTKSAPDRPPNTAMSMKIGISHVLNVTSCHENETCTMTSLLIVTDLLFTKLD